MMNPYTHKEISNHLDRRIVDVFVNQNRCNAWLVSADVASWVFQSNMTTAYQQNYVYTKLFTLLGMEYTIEVEQSFLERTRIQQGEFMVDAFRLKDASLVKADVALPSLKEQIENAFTSQSAQRQ